MNRPSSGTPGVETRAAIRSLRWRILALDRESDFQGFLLEAARYLVSGTGATAGAVVARYVEQGEDFLLWVGQGVEPWQRTVPLPLRTEPLAARGEAMRADRFTIPEVQSWAESRDAAPSYVLRAGISSSGRRGLQVELADPDPRILPDAEAMGELLAEVGAAFELAFLYDRLRRERLETKMLLEVGRELGRTLELETVLDTILKLLAPVVPYDAAAIYVLGDDALDVASQSIGYGSEAEEIVRLKLDEGIVGRVARTEEPVILADVSLDPEYYEARANTVSELVVPVVSGGKVLGVFNLESDRSNAYTGHHLQLLTTFAVQAGVALERARLLQEQEAKRQLDQELKIARRIQRTFLPRPRVAFPDRGLASRTLPSREVSGDYVDVIEREDGEAVAVADVSGKGIPASLIMAALRTGFHLLAGREDPAPMSRQLNLHLHQSLRDTEFVTGVFGVLDKERRRFRYCNAGHVTPFLVRADGRLEDLVSGGPLLGVLPDAGYEEGEVDLGPGDRVVLYTDGVNEAWGPGGEEFGLEQLQEVVRAHAHERAPEIVEAIVRAVHDFVEGPLPDDLTVLVIEGGER